MGRCYEFGAEIQAGCERTMVVVPEGGACECAGCGARCPGRFAGCADVVAVPGRVPLSAPAWARPGAATEEHADHGPPPIPRRPADTAPRPRSLTAALPEGASRLEPGEYHPAAVTNGNGHPTAALDMAPLHTALDELRQMVLTATERPAAAPVDTSALLAAVDELATKLLDRDERLARSFLAFGERQAELAEQVGRLTEALTLLDKGTAAPGSLRHMLSRKL